MADRDDVRERIEGLLAAMSNSDGAYIRELVAEGDDVLIVGTDDIEWWRGQDGPRIWATQVEELRGMRIESSDLSAEVDGDVGWTSARLRVTLPDGSTAPPVRMTTVLRRDDGTWRLVMSHASFGAPNDEALGLELTTE
jgi:ketosteroid isomerase-like protein